MSPIRFLLREAITSAHERIDEAFTQLSPRRRNDHRKFLTAHASVILPSEALGTQAGAGHVLHDRSSRRRTDALLDDLADLGLQPPPLHLLGACGGPARVPGTWYVLEGPWLGTRVPRQGVLAGPDAGGWAAAACPGHGMERALWPSSPMTLAASPHAKGNPGPVIEGAHDAFAAFERAAPPGAGTGDLADATAP